MVALSRGAVWPATLPVAGPRFSRCLGASARCLAPQPRSRLSWSDPASRRGGVAAPWRRVQPGRLPSPAVAALPRPAAELLDAVPGKGELLSPRLDADVRQRAANAIELRGGRVTIGDVASTAGLRLNQAEEAVRALAADSQATLQVAEDGEIVWVFARGFQDTIRSKSLLLRLEPAAKAIKAGAEYLARVAFGTALFASVAVVFAALVVLANSGNDNNRQRNNNSSSYSGGSYYGGGPRFYINLTDLLWYWDPGYSRQRQERLRGGGGMNFLEAIFSCVFGDGDPNADFDRKRWQAVGRYIQMRGGTVAAEELAPLLDLKPGQLAADRGRIAVDESYMLPVLARFNGSPQVDAAGNIVYTFPELQATAKASLGGMPRREAAYEKRWQLTAASAGQKLGVAALGALNLFGVVALSLKLGDPTSKLALAQNGMLWLLGAMPFLQAYAASFVAVPFVRFLLNQGRNAAIDSRNEARKQALALLERPDATLRSKLAGAARKGQQRVVTDREVVYRSDRPLDQQPSDLEAADFEARLRRRERDRQAPQGGGRQQQQQGANETPMWWRQQQAQRQRQRDG
ncbi:hypothetical protein ABPG77_006315 [Micractinium sp. CCAP 211/92]